MNGTRSGSCGGDSSLAPAAISALSVSLTQIISAERKENERGDCMSADGLTLDDILDYGQMVPG